MIEFSLSIPTITKYEELLSSNLFHIIEDYSNAFIQANGKYLRPYASKWVKDPLHQWSRQWEYPFVYSKIMQAIKPNSNLQILDAGSGITFFPYFLQSQSPSSKIICGDIARNISTIFQQINKNWHPSVLFNNMNLKMIPYEDESFDLVYCISVIEHTRKYTEIIDEFYRIIKPGGKLLITFDISIDGTATFTPPQSQGLMEYIMSKFKCPGIKSNIIAELSQPDIVTTQYAYKKDAKLLPGGRAYEMKTLVKSLIKGKSVKKYPPLYSFYNLECIKELT